MPGWRIGYAVNRRLAPLLARWVTNTDSCAPSLCQWAALEALSGPQNAAEAMRKSFRIRRDLVIEQLNRIPGVRAVRPGGAFYVWANVTELCRWSGAKDSEQLRRRLLHQANIALLSDVYFGPRTPGEGEHVRMSYASSIPDLQEGLRRLETFAHACAPVAAGAAGAAGV